jgi:hypothetical protein
MSEKLRICLVGPRNAGKSSLLASLTDCVMQSAHGYSPDLHPALQPIARSEFERAEGAASKSEILENFSDSYERLRQELAMGGQLGGQPTPSRDLYEYYFRLTVNGAAPAGVGRAPILLEIVDASGDIGAPEEGAPQDVAPGVREKFAAKLLGADAIVFVLPLVRFDHCRWVGALARLIERLALAPEKKAKRIVVAFSQYERLFVQLGPSAFTYACDPAVALHVLRKCVQAAPWTDVLRSLDAKVRFTAFSAFGFTKSFQNPNLDPHEAGEQRFCRMGADGRRMLGEFWRPFLTAEPILFSGLDFDSAFTFSYAQIDGADPAAMTHRAKESVEAAEDWRSNRPD